MENVLQFMRENWLSNRIFTAYKDVSPLLDAWRAYRPAHDHHVIGLRLWAHSFLIAATCMSSRPQR
jgi:hypothetical protein